LARGGEGQLNEQQQDAQKAEDLIQESEDPVTRLTEGVGNTYNTNAPAFAFKHKQLISTGLSFSTNGTPTSEGMSFEMVAAPSVVHSAPSVSGTFSSPKLEDQEIVERLSLQEDMLSTGVKATFDRASNIIRESIEVEGSIFIDAAIGSFGGLVANGDGSESTDTSLSSGLTSSGESSGSSMSTKSGTVATVTRMCGVLGFSTSTESSINNSIVSKAHGLVPERLLKVW